MIKENFSKIKTAIAANPDFIIFSSMVTIISGFIFPILPSDYVKPLVISCWMLVLLYIIFHILIKLRIIQKSKKMMLLFSLYLIFTLFFWWLSYEKNWTFYKLSLYLMKTPELSQDVILVDIPYPDRIRFRKNTGIFLQKLAKSPQKPSAVGLDIIFKKFEQETEEVKNATSELVKGIKALTQKDIPVIAGYDPQSRKDAHEEKLYELFTDTGHNLIHVRDGKFHAKVFEETEKTAIGTELKPFFGLLIVKQGNRLGEDYPHNIEKKYSNIIPVLYQKEFKFKTLEFPDTKEYDAVLKNTDFDKKALIIGNFANDYKPDADFYGLHCIGYTVQMLTDQAKSRDILIAFESRGLLIAIVTLLCSFLVIAAFLLISRFITNRILTAFISVILVSIIFLSGIAILLKFNYLFADLALVLSGILTSGILCFFCKNSSLRGSAS